MDPRRTQKKHTYWEQKIKVESLREFESISITRRQYGAPAVVESTKVPGEVVALTHHRGLQFSWLYKYLGQGESPPRLGYVEMRENEYE